MAYTAGLNVLRSYEPAGGSAKYSVVVLPLMPIAAAGSRPRMRTAVSDSSGSRPPPSLHDFRVAGPSTDPNDNGWFAVLPRYMWPCQVIRSAQLASLPPPHPEAAPISAAITTKRAKPVEPGEFRDGLDGSVLRTLKRYAHRSVANKAWAMVCARSRVLPTRHKED
jgi:hypothetical protein